MYFIQAILTEGLKFQLQCECPNNWIWSQDAFATKTSGAKILQF